jgi:hypothetical protein
MKIETLLGFKEILRYGITFARPTSETKNGPTKETTILPNLRFRIYTKITSTLQQVKSRQPHATRQHVHKMVVSFVLGFSLHGAPHPRVLRLTCGSTTACQGPRLCAGRASPRYRSLEPWLVGGSEMSCSLPRAQYRQPMRLCVIIYHYAAV